MYKSLFSNRWLRPQPATPSTGQLGVKGTGEFGRMEAVGPGGCQQTWPYLLALPGTQVGCSLDLSRIGQSSPRGLGFFVQRSVEPPRAGPHPKAKARARLWLHHSTHCWLLGLHTALESIQPQPSLDKFSLGLPAVPRAQGSWSRSGSWFLPNMLLGKAWPSVTSLMGT